MNGLIIGYGSIGRRHAQGLSMLGCQITLVSSQTVEQYVCVKTLAEALAQSHFDFIIIANATYLHAATLHAIAAFNYQGIILVEKPLFASVETCSPAFSSVFVAYNLRFSHLIRVAKKITEDEDVISFSVHTGQYLPDWRVNKNYQSSYSATKAHGGGVLRDLSHELDYALWCCGPWSDVTGLGGQFSDLKITSEDIYTILLRTHRCPLVSFHLNYLDRVPRREITIQTNKRSIFIDLVKGYWAVNGEIKEHVAQDVQNSYVKQYQALLAGNFHEFCSYHEGLETVRLIQAIEESNQSNLWVHK